MGLKLSLVAMVFSTFLYVECAKTDNSDNSDDDKSENVGGSPSGNKESDVNDDLTDGNQEKTAASASASAISFLPNIAIQVPSGIGDESSSNLVDSTVSNMGIVMLRNIMKRYRDNARTISSLVCRLKKLKIPDNEVIAIHLPFELGSSTTFKARVVATDDDNIKLKMCAASGSTYKPLLVMDVNKPSGGGAATYYPGLGENTENSYQFTWQFNQDYRRIATNYTYKVIILGDYKGKTDLTRFKNGKFTATVRQQISNTSVLFRAKVYAKADVGVVNYYNQDQSQYASTATEDTIGFNPESGETLELDNANQQLLESLTDIATTDLVTIAFESDFCASLGSPTTSYSVTHDEFDDCTAEVIEEEAQVGNNNTNDNDNDNDNGNLNELGDSDNANSNANNNLNANQNNNS